MIYIDWIRFGDSEGDTSREGEGLVRDTFGCKAARFLAYRVNVRRTHFNIVRFPREPAPR